MLFFTVFTLDLDYLSFYFYCDITNERPSFNKQPLVVLQLFFHTENSLPNKFPP